MGRLIGGIVIIFAAIALLMILASGGQVWMVEVFFDLRSAVAVVPTILGLYWQN